MGFDRSSLNGKPFLQGAPVVKLFLGLVKGLVIGAAVGYGAHALHQSAAAPVDWLTYGLIGAVVGLLVGRPIWKNIFDKEATAWVSVLKAIFGFAIGVGLYFLVDKAWGGFRVDAGFLGIEGTRSFQDLTPIFGGVIGALYGAFVELDDSLDDSKAAPKKLPETTAKPAKK
jgi:hypothetical protein